MSKITKRLIWLFALVALVQSTSLLAQNFKRRYDIPVSSGEGPLKFPWVGGLNAPQINTMDLNGDGIEDLVLFERFANKVYTFIIKGDSYQYEPKYEHLFPANLTNWVLLRDFNKDGKKDIFTANPFGLVVFVNTTKAGSEDLTWRPFNSGEALMSVGTYGPINLQVDLTSIPSIADIDGDGDLDILTAIFSGNSTIELHQNQSIERGQHSDTIEMVRTTQRWGDVEDCGCGKFKFDGQSCFGGGRIQHFGAKAVVTYDIDGDGDHDLFYSDEYCSSISFLRNVGDINLPVFQTAEPFLGLVTAGFPVAFFEDVDADGVKDFIASSNFSSRSDYQSDFASSLWKYKGLGSGGLSFSQSNFLQGEMIDVGDDAMPAFADADGDGDMDLFVGSYLTSSKRGAIFYFKNVGTQSIPEFILTDSDYGKFSNSNLVNIKPVFADVNQDGKKDLVFTASDFNTGVHGLYYLENESANSIQLKTEIKTIAFNLIWEEKVTFTDFNADGALDIIKGTYFGSIELWLNQGNNQYTFSDKLDYLGSGFNSTSPSLVVMDINVDGKEDLLMGGSSGYLKVVYDYKSRNTTPVDLPVQNLANEKFEAAKLAGRLFPSVVRLYQTRFPQIVVGTSGGGLIFLYPENEEALSLDPQFQLYPNPISKSELLHLSTEANGVMELSTVVGEVIIPSTEVIAYQTYRFDLSDLSRGVYFVRLTLADGVFMRRIIVR